MTKHSNPNARNAESLISPQMLKEGLPPLAAHLEFIEQSRQQIQRILSGEDSRLFLVVGPCSIHDITAAKEYAIKLRHLSDKISKHFFVVMRTHFEKPRTSLGWKGLLHDPHLDGSNAISTGLNLSRELLLFLADLGLPAATEFLDPITFHYLGDLISWACIGARTSESQIHRQFASGLPMPVAFKNSTSGNIDVAINGVLAATCSHSFFGITEHGSLSIVETKGNRHAHVALRGGELKPNYDADSIAYALEQLKKNHLPQQLVIDCSHD
nr:3-deoxy-7-phosphoheptulonate synthase [Parachlamydiaceae bacterium]